MSVLRIIDANANRAREALRVMEEAARFVLDDRDLTAAIKRLRHDVTAATRRIDGLELHRDTPGDVGTELETATEMSRATATETAVAAGKRLGEALRVLEEYGKVIDVEFARQIESRRYAAYEIEQRLHRALGAGRATQWGVTVLLSEAVCAGRSWRDVADRVLEAEPDCLQIREKDLPDAELLARAGALVERASPATAVVVNDRPDVALLAHAHGVHLGQTDLPCHAVRAMVGRRLVIGVSTSTIGEAEAARRDGADYCGVGPMFASETKHKERIAGPAYLREYLAWGGLPHVAIGGITPDNVEALVAAGCRGVAASQSVCAAPDPGVVVRALEAAISSRRERDHARA